MNRTTLLTMILLATCFAATAQQNPAETPASKEDVQKYMQIVHSKEIAQKTMDALIKPMHQMTHEQCSKDNMPADCESRLNKLQSDMMANMPWDEMLDSMVPVYQKHFSKADMDNLSAFYSTPTGQKLLNEMPSIMAETMQSMMPILRKRMEAINQRMQDEISAMAKETGSKNPKTGQQTNN